MIYGRIVSAANKIAYRNIKIVRYVNDFSKVNPQDFIGSGCHVNLVRFAFLTFFRHESVYNFDEWRR